VTRSVRDQVADPLVIADAAGVSAQTIYHLVGGKAVLLKEVYDVTLAVRDAATGRESLARYATMSRVLGERLLSLLTTLLAQASAPADERRRLVERWT
jgi:AcrR family transcriptional regulator